MRRRHFLGAAAVSFASSNLGHGNTVPRQIAVSLPQVHKGTLEVDTSLLDSYGPPPSNRRQFYLGSRNVFSTNRQARFEDKEILDLARSHSIDLMGGPMLGQLKSDGVSIWLRPANDRPLSIDVAGKSFPLESVVAGKEVHIEVSGLRPNRRYPYQVIQGNREVASGQFRTAPLEAQPTQFRMTFGSCFHKVGIHNPNLFRQIINREPSVMMLLGDLAVDDRNDNVAMHRSDYQLRDVSEAWREFSSQIPNYACWDDHDYFDNDLNGIPKGFSADDRDALRRVWNQNWNNPSPSENREGIYFSSRVGPVEVIMLDTRSCRDNRLRHKPGCYLGNDQMEWLLKTLNASTAPFKVISSGTMWSDYVSKAKDSWGSWDTEAREQIFSFIEEKKIRGVLLVSGDRHGARAFRIPRRSGFSFYEFEPATLGGHTGPAALVDNCPEQIFGYGRDNLIAFGEFTFDTSQAEPRVTFRLIRENGEILEEHTISYEDLTPR
ncbi:MAG: alkaline phosphatase D family protein [Planctomycetota bacterium]